MTFDSLGSHFTWRCRQQPDALAYAMVRDTLELAESLTYAQLHEQVLALGARIARHSKAGDRVLLVYPAGLDFVRAFWACMLTGRIAVPVPAPDPVRFKNGGPRLLAIIEDARAALVLTMADLLEPAQAFFAETGGTPALWMATDTPAPDEAANAAAPSLEDLTAQAPGPQSVAYLQYTSGSTATPRGVALTQSNVLEQCRTCLAAVHVVPGSSRILCWLPHYHDYGLVFGVLAPFQHGIPSYLMSPVTFLRRPLRWLEAVARFGITHTGGPNFAYAACLKALAQQPQWQGDLRTLVSATCGAEPIQSKTGRDFQALFEAHGLPAGTFAPSYGMAEAVLTVTTSPPATPMRVLSLDADGMTHDRVRLAHAQTERRRDVVGCGQAIEGMRVRIVHPKTLRPCAADGIGEVWVQGSSVGQGYWQQPNVSDETFRARMADGDGPWLRTGDLGFVHDGDLYITGRLKDLIIVHGRNHAPQDIEWTVQRTDPSLRPGFGAAFSVDTTDGEALVVVQEMERRGHEVDLMPVIRAIRKAVATEHELPVHAVALVRSGSVPRTSSGKVRRQHCKQDYLEGSLQVLQMEVAQTLEALDEAPWSAADFAAPLAGEPGSVQRLLALEQMLVQGVARFARQAPQAIALDASAIECGLDSLSGFRLLQVLESALGRSLPPAALLGEPSLRAVARRLDLLLDESPAPAEPVKALATADRQGLLPLSAAQQRMWFWQELAPGTALYNVPVALELHGPLDANILQHCLHELIQRHEVLRTRWVSHHGQQRQRIEPMHDWRMRHQVFAHSAAASKSQQYEALAAQEALTPFDLTREPAVRATLVTLGALDHRLLWTLHHSVCDGWSMGVLMDELCALYEARSRGLPVRLPKLALQALDHAAWEAGMLADGVRERELAYWKRQLADVPATLALPADHRRPAQQQFRGATMAVNFSAAQFAALQALARRTDTTLFMALLAVWQTLLHRWSGQGTVVTGSVIANRERREFDGVVGYFANTLALRSDFEDGLTVAGLLAQVKATALGAYAHQHVPFDEVIDALKLPRDASRMPLIQTFVVLQPPADGQRRLGDVQVRRSPLASPVARFDLSLELQPVGDRLQGWLEYDRDLFERETVERMAGHVLALVEAMAADPQRPVAGVPLLGEAERQRLLLDWNRTERAYALGVGVHTLIEQQSRHTPLAIAATFVDQHLSYRDLNLRANRLAHHLRRLGVGPDVKVGLCMERSTELVVALLAVLKAGGAFVPLDPELPRERLAFMLDDTAAPVVLTQTRLQDRVPPATDGATRILLCLDAEPAATLPADDLDPPGLTGPDHLAYVIYTSGSTGQPKGVMVPHRALSNHTLWLREHMGMARGDLVLQVTTIAFDAALCEFFSPLISGASIVLTEPGAHRDTGYLVRTMRGRRITNVLTVPALLRVLLDEPGLEGCVHLRQVICGGEALSLELARDFQRRLPQATLHNLYGPTETTINSTACIARGDFGASLTVPIGRPIANTECHVLDANRQPVPTGVPGELYIGGAGLARGYLNQPELTADRFVPHPFTPGQRVYRTGDHVRWLHDGRLEYLGRADFQVKIRGIRVELGEIEAALNMQEGVQHCVVMAREDQPGLRHLVAYMVGTGIDFAELKRSLQRHLAEALVPSAFVLLPRLPTLPSGKIDRHALPAPQRTAGSADSVAPRTAVEQTVWDIWRELLKVPQFSVHDNFFELGGHSLLATQAMARLRAALGVQLPLRSLFDSPTVAGLADTVERQRIATTTDPAEPPSIERVAREGLLSLSLGQQRMWFWQELAPGTALYNVPMALELHGPLDARVLQASLQALIERHEILRTRWVARGGERFQCIEPAGDWRMRLVRLDELPEPARESHYEALAAQEAAHGFDLCTEFGVRAVLVRVGEQDHRLLWTLHHSVCDGWSMGVLLDELCLLYGASTRGLPAELPRQELQYLDFAAWEARALDGGLRERELAYWKRHLADAPASLALPTDHRRPAQQRFRGATLELRFSEPELAALSALARRTGTTLFMTVLALWQTLLHRHSGQTTVVTGSVIANRERREFEATVGYFANTLALRSDFDAGLTVAGLMAQVKATALAAYAHQHVPFEEVVNALQLPRDTSRMPLIQTFVVLQPPAEAERRLGDVRMHKTALASPVAKFDLTLDLQEVGSELVGYLEYDTDLFERTTVERMATQLHTLVAAMCADSGRPVAELALLGDAERHLVLHEWNDTARPYALHVGVHTLIEQQAQRTPLAVAVAFAEQRLSYDELNARANRQAHHLRRLGVGPDAVVGVCLDRSIELVVGLLAVLKAGGAFLPLDPELPPDRLRHMLDDSRAVVVLTHSARLDRLPAADATRACPVLCLDTPLAAQPGDDHNPAAVGGPERLAYVIYTSGSTGQPKGVMVPHRALSNHTLWSQDTLQVRRGDRLLQKTTIGFDAAIQDFFVPLQAGATIVLAAPGEHRDTGYLVRTLREERITMVSMVPAQLRLLLDEPGLESCVHLRHVVCGGEALGLDLARDFRRRLPNVTLGNFYGPSETTIDATHCVAQGDFGDSATVPIGRPIANAQCYVLDAQRQPVPIGVTGELCIGGAGLAHGYLNRPELTAERFVAHPFAPGQRVYRTGDLVRWLPDGRLEYLGRSDFQVKVRGIRIELGEIEAALHALPSVRHCTVVAREDQPGLKRLVAYVVGHGGPDPIDADALRQALLKQLPEPMVPSAFVSLPQLPLLPNGKINRHALPAPGLPSVAGDLVAPRTPLEQAVAAAWQDVLQLPPFGVHDNFFQLGGHSLLAMQVISRLRNSLQVEMPLRALFDAPSVAQLAEWIAAQDARAGRAAIPKAPASAGATVPMTSAQRGLWLVERLQGNEAANTSSYNIVQATRLRGPLDRHALERSLQRLCERHDSLHMGVVEHGGVPTLAVQPEARWPLQDLAWPPIGPDAGRDAEHALQALLDDFAHRPFDLTQAPLARAGLIRLDDLQHVVVLVIHHIACDGWSLDVLLTELAASYEAECTQRSAALAPLPLQWRDVAFWEQSRTESGALDTSLDYWRQQLQGLEPLRLPAEASSDDAGPLETLVLPGELVRDIETLARHHNATVFMTLLAAIKLLLMRRFGQLDVAVGAPVAGRDRPELESLVGLLLNTLVLRTDLGGDPSFAELLRRVRTTTLDAWAHQDVPFDRLVAELAPTRDAVHTPFFDVLVNAFGRFDGALTLAGLASEPIIAAPSPKFALSLYVQATPGAITLAAVHRADRLSGAAVRGLLEQFSDLLHQVVAEPAMALSEVSLLTPAARTLLADPAQPLVAPPFTPVIDRFLAHVRRAPSHPAVRRGGREHDYAALHDAATALARRLREQGLARGDVVAICGPRSAAVVAGMLAALMSGAVFVTLDPALPVHRREIMLREAGARWLLLVGREATQRSGPPPPDVRGTLVLDPELDALLAARDNAGDGVTSGFTPVQPLGDDPAYIFFTSGSTGTPKAVLGRHRGLSHFLEWQCSEFGITPQDRVSQLIGLSFDPLLRDVFLPLSSGATLCIPQDRDLLDPTGWLAREAVSVVHSTPTVLQAWLQGARAGHTLAALRWLFVAGEPLTDALVGAWRARFGTQGRIVNLYGPTETTMARCFHVLGERLPRGIQPVGRALPDSQALVLGADGLRCGIGEVGEVVLRSPLRSLGYLGLPEENRRRFRANPWRPQADAAAGGDDTEDLLYFTGDLGRFRADGVLEIAGRLDDQVKIRGVRIEPAEVMAALARHPRVRHCVVVPQTDDDGQPMLVAYVACGVASPLDPATEPLPSAAELRAHVASELPEAFVPGAFVFLDALPTQANGKVDRKRLPPRGEPSDADTRPQALVMPRSPVEQALWDIWRQVLRVEAFGVFESFFALGGHSLLATQVVARVRDVLGVELPLRALFETPSIAALAAAVDQQLHAAPDAALPAWPAILPVPRGQPLPTSYSQRRMWLVQQFNPGTTAYNMPFAVRLRGPLDRDVLVASLQCLVARHEAFRTTVVAVAGEPMQCIGPLHRADVGFRVETLDLSELPEAEREAEAAQALNRRSSQPYDLAQGPLHRPTLVRLADDDHVLFWSIHHAIGDGWSAGILLREIAVIYPALAQGQEPSLPPMAIDFADYADWQRRVLSSTALANQLAFWKQALVGLEPLPLPLDRPRRGGNSGRGASVSATFQPQTLTALKSLSVQHGVTPYMALLACFQLLLARHCDTTDVAVGTPIANRTHMASEHLVGTLVNTVVMRTDLAGDPTFAELLRRVRETALQAYAHQDLPFEALVEALAVPRSDGSAPLVQVLFNVLNAPTGERIPGLVYEPFEFDTGSSQFDLALSIDMQVFGHAHLSFSTEVFEHATGQRLLTGFVALLEQVVVSPERPLSTFELASAQERAVLAGWNHTPLALPAGAALVHAHIAQQAERTPAQPALRCGNVLLSHAELQARALRLARALRARGVARGSLVGLCLPRGVDMVVAQLAILHSGAAYVPLDPAYPADRLAYMAQDAALALVVTLADNGELGTTLDWPAERSLLLDRDAAFIAAQSAAPLTPDEALDARPADPAYVIYTSGSTGRPKGVVLPHEAVVNFLTSMAREPGLQAGDVLVAVTTLSFDIAVLELLLPLFVGATVVLARRDEATDGRALRTLLETNRATVMQATPSSWRMLIDAGWQGFDGFRALIGGEGLPPDLAQQLLARTGPHGALWNLYGPTETTVWSTCWKVAAPEQGIRIGGPIANTQVHVLDAHGQPCPIGVAGEVFIGGAGVALGYLNRPELTAERFLPDPFSPQSSATPGARMYRTGDRGRWCHDGRLEHLGRLDFQVKVRGHRIELGEIEAALGGHAQVARAVVIVREDRPGDLRLVAYVVPKGEMRNGEAPTAAALREHLRGSLPDYMLPQHVVPIDAVPLLPNGKMDRHALPPPDRSADAPGERPLAPDELLQTDTERAVAAVWQALLGPGPIARSDNFFDLGGHSLLAMRAVGEMERQAGLRVELRRLVHESLAQIAATPVQVVALATSPPISQAAAPPTPVAPATGLQRVIRSVRDLIGS